MLGVSKNIVWIWVIEIKGSGGINHDTFFFYPAMTVGFFVCRESGLVGDEIRVVYFDPIIEFINNLASISS